MLIQLKRDPGRIAFAISLMMLALTGCDRSGSIYQDPPPREVTYAHPMESSITPFVDENGITEAKKEAEVRSRVRGFLESVEFQPGQRVKKDDVLYMIERSEYEAAYDAAQAAVESAIASIAVAEAEVRIADAALLNAKQGMDREERLKQQNASSQANYDAAVAQLAAAEASLESAKANVQSARAKQSQAAAALEQAKLDLDYTEVRAEIDGHITKTNFKEGNLIELGSQLATIVDDSEVYANFSVSDRALLRLRRARRASGQTAGSDEDASWRGIPVYLAREGDRGYPFEGKLDYVDQAGIQSDTGTLGLRAVFENTEQELFPGLFVSLRVPAANAVASLVIPERALQRDQLGPFVLTINNENKIERARIELGQTVSGWAIVLEGISRETRVVVDGLQFAREGQPVVPIEVSFEVDPLMLLRGLIDPDRAVQPGESNDAASAAIDSPPASDPSAAP